MNELKKKLAKFGAICAVLTMLIACNTGEVEYVTKYVEVEIPVEVPVEVPVPSDCDNPNHDNTCDGNHDHLHDDCNQGREFPDYTCPGTTKCYQGLVDVLEEAINEVSDGCAKNGCTQVNKNLHFGNVYRKFNEAAFDNANDLHVLTNNDSIYKHALTGGVSAWVSPTNQIIAPCLSPEDIQMAKEEAIASVDHTN